MKTNRFQALWIAVHGLVFLSLAVLFFCGTKYKINTNLFDILPQADTNQEFSNADKILSNKTGRVFVILVKGKGFENARGTADQLYNLLNSEENKSRFESLSFYVGENTTADLKEYYYQNRYFLLNQETAEGLSTGEGLDNFLIDSQLTIYNAFSTFENVEEDPFDLSEIELMETLGKLMNNGTSMSPHDGVLCAFKGEDCYVMLRGVLSQKGASITNKDSGVKKIYEYIEQIKKTDSSGCEFIYSGVPFHSYESSSSAQKEITVISVVSMMLIVLLCIYFFRNILPVISSVGAIVISALFALACVLLVFKEIHILTFVFGTTLIGTCLDYSVHYFVRWKGDLALNSGNEVRSHLIKGLSLSLLSTEICYLLLFFAQFTLLKQVAVFSFSGILSSYLTVICLYPLFKNPKEKKEIPLTKTLSRINEINPKTQRIAFMTIILVIVVIFGFAKKNVRIENNLKSFYSMEGDLLKSEIESNKILNSGSNGWYFIVKGKTKEELLKNESELCRSIDKFIVHSGNKEYTYNATTKYIPSFEAQEKSYKSIEYLFPEIINQYLVLGYNLEQAEKLKINLINNYVKQTGHYIDPENDVPLFMKDAVSNLWIGEVNKEWFSVVMPMHFTDSELLRTLAAENSNVYFMNKVEDVGNQLNKLTKLMLSLLCIAFIIMTCVLLFFYNWKKVLKIISIPLVTVCACIAVLGACNIPLGFFSVTGIILVFGLSIDYIIYAVENSEAQNTVAILLSFVSSALSFGALALSSFAPVFMFGMAVFVGLVTAVMTTVLVKD